MLLSPGFTFGFVTFPLLIPSDYIDFVHGIIPSFGLIILITLCFIIHNKLPSLRGSISGGTFNSPADQLCRRFTFAEIRAATSNFSDAFVIGKGGFGKVFKGIIDNGATTVAIKRLDPMSKQGGKEFSTEIEMLSKCRHSHVVSLIGYCDNNDEMILVYEYVVNGSLADHLYKEKITNGSNSTMSWVKRVKICLGAARGLDYLHTGTGVLQRVIHRDMKSSNILLDENWAAKISDFGLSKIGPANQSFTHVTTCVKGTPGYCDPEYFLTRRLTRKSDVYSFGVVLFEVLCGRSVLDSRLPKEQRSLVAWAQHCIEEDKIHQLIDPSLRWEIFENSLKAFVKIANQCLHSRPKKRPTMSEVVASLEVALALQESKDSSVLDEDIFDFGETYDDREAVGSATVQSDVVYTDSSTILMPLSHHPPTVPSEGSEKTSLGENTTREEILGGNGAASFSLEEGPGIDGFQIIGDAKLGGRLLGCGYPIRRTSLCMFQWVHYLLRNNTSNYIEGATNPEYIVTADDVDKIIAVECIPMDDQGRQGKLVRAIANNQKRITCEPNMRKEIDAYIPEGQATFNVLLLMDSLDRGVATDFVLDRSGYHVKVLDRSEYHVKVYGTETTVIAEKFSEHISIKIPLGLTSKFVLTCSDGSSHSFNTYNDIRMRDKLVLTMRTFMRKALDERDVASLYRS